MIPVFGCFHVFSLLNCHLVFVVVVEYGHVFHTCFWYLLQPPFFVFPPLFKYILSGLNQFNFNTTYKIFQSTCTRMKPNLCVVQIRYRKDRMQSKLKPCFPVVNEVKDLSNGCAIAAVIHHYCPGLLRLEGTTPQVYSFTLRFI